MITCKFKAGDVVKNTNYPESIDDPSPWKYLGETGIVVGYSFYVKVKFSDGTIQLLKESELELVTAEPDVVGNQIRVGDTIVYFVRGGSAMWAQKAKVEFIGVKNSKGPHIRVLKEDAEQKDLFTRKSWLWSFNNSVKVG